MHRDAGRGAVKGGVHKGVVLGDNGQAAAGATQHAPLLVNKQALGLGGGVGVGGWRSAGGEGMRWGEGGGARIAPVSGAALVIEMPWLYSQRPVQPT